jgi:hypothetical protein
MSKHTSTPWRIAADMRGIENASVHGVEAADGTPIANCGDWADAEANARRIVACVNACAGIETAVLEQHALGVIAAEHSQALANLKNQRDVEPYCWKVTDVVNLYMGEHAEEFAKAQAKRIGGTCTAFPLYTRPQPASKLVGLTPEDYQSIREKISDSVSDFVIADIAAIVEAKLMGKNT